MTTIKQFMFEFKIDVQFMDLSYGWETIRVAAYDYWHAVDKAKFLCSERHGQNLRVQSLRSDYEQYSDRQVKLNAMKKEAERMKEYLMTTPRVLTVECTDGTWERVPKNTHGYFGWHITWHNWSRV